MEPISTISSALKTPEEVAKAVGAIDKLIDKATAAKRARDDAAYYGAYIEIAGKSIKALEGDYLGILLQAKRCDLGATKDRKALEARINGHMHGERFRSRLKEALDRLKEGRQVLLEHVNKRVLLPGMRKRRALGLEKFDEILAQLDGYLGSLGEYEGPSAVALKDITDIQELLFANSPNQKPFDEKVKDLLDHLDKSALISVAGDCGRAIEALRMAFR
jgi:hypothetical protein